MAPPYGAQRAAGGAGGAGSGTGRRLVEVELRSALKPWIPAGFEGWEEARLALRKLNLDDLQNLRREVNKRLVPERALRELLTAAHKEGRLAAPPSGGGRSAAWPLPDDERDLVSLAERILELESLREVVRSQLDQETDQQQACLELLEQGVDSVRALSVAKPQAFRKGFLQGDRLLALLKAAGLRAAEDEAGQLARRCELQPVGKEPFLATAPHNAFLRRDGQPMHSLEEYTSILARAMASELGGSALCWSRQAQWRTELRYSMGHRRKALGEVKEVQEELDPSNRDPNYLLPEELPHNAWFHKLRAWTAGHKGQCMLHVDVHGCQDPPKHPAHCMLGLAAMRQHAESLKPEDPQRRLTLNRMEVFAEFLELSVGAVFAQVLGIPAQEAVTMTGLREVKDEQGEHVQTLSGAWPPEWGRLTQTQQSTSHADATHALQLEMGRTLRHALIKDPAAVAKLARAIHGAWRQTVDAESNHFMRGFAA